MPIYESNGKKYNIPDDKVDAFLKSRNDAKLVDSTPYYLSRATSTPRQSNIQNQNYTQFEEIPVQQPNKGIAGGFTTFKDGTSDFISDIKIEQPKIDISSAGTGKDTGSLQPFGKGKPLTESIGDAIKNMPVRPEVQFDIAQSTYKQNQDWIKEVQNDPSISPEVKRALIDDYNKNIRISDNTIDDKDLPLYAKQWLENNKVSVPTTVYIPGSPMFGGGQYVESTKQANTPEQISLIKDFIANTPQGQDLVNRQKAYVEYLENSISDVETRVPELKNKIWQELHDLSRSHPYPMGRTKGKAETDVARKDYYEKYSPLTKRMSALNLAEKNAEEQKKLLAAVKDGDLNVLSQFGKQIGRDFWEMAGDIGTLGIRPMMQSLYEYYDVKGLQKRMESGEPLSEEDRLAMSALANNQAYQELMGDRRTIAQEVASGITQSAPFMVNLATTGGIGKAATGGAKELLKQGIKRNAVNALRRGVNTNTVKIGSRLAGFGLNVADATGRASVMAAISPNTYRDMFDNMTGQVTYAYGEEGKPYYLGNIEQMDLSNALLNAWGSNTIENVSEFSGFGIEKGQAAFSRLLKQRVPEVAKALSFGSTRNKFLQGVNKVMKTARFNGTVNEFLEEQVATALHSFFEDGQAQWSDLVDPRQQFITFLTVASIGSGSAIMNTHGNRMMKYGARKAYDNAFKDFGTEFYNSQNNDIAGQFANAVRNGTIEEKLSALSNIVNSDLFNDKQKLAALNLYRAGLTYESYEGTKEAKVKEATQYLPAMIEDNANSEMGAIVSATIVGMDTPVQITGGNIVQNEDGTINKKLSDQEIYYTDADGKRQVTSINYVENITENIPTQDAIAQVMEQVAAPIIAQQQNDEVRPYQAGETVRFSPDGNTSLIGQIEGQDQATGNYILMVETPNGIQQMQVQPRHIFNEDNLEGVENGSPVIYTNQNGELVLGVVATSPDLYAQGLIGFENGDVVPVGNVVGLAGDNELPSLSANVANTDNLKSNIQQNEDITPVELSNVKANEPRVFEIEKGLDAVENTDGSYTLNKRFAKSELKKADNLINKLNEDYSDNGLIFGIVQLPKQDASNPFEKPLWGIIARMQSATVDNPQLPVSKNASAKPLERKLKKSVKKDTRPKKPTPFQRRLQAVEPNVSTVRDRILYGIASGAYKFRWKDQGVSMGLARELGQTSEKERRSRISLLSNNGYTPSTLAQHIWEETGMQLKDNDIRSEIIDVLNSVYSRKQALETLESSLSMNEDTYYQEQQVAAEFEQEQISQAQDFQLEISEQLAAMDIDNLLTLAKDLGLSLEELGNTYTAFDLVTQLEQLEQIQNEETELQSGRDRTNEETDSVVSRSGNTSETTERTVGERNRSSEETGDRTSDSDSQNDYSDLTSEEQRIVDETNTLIDAEINDVSTQLQQKKSELNAAKKRIGNAYAEDNQTNLFGQEQTSDTLFDVPRDFSQSNIANIIEPIQQEINALTGKLNNLNNSRNEKINETLENFRSQGTIDFGTEHFAIAETEDDNIQSWINRFKKAKSENNFGEIQDIYDKLRVLLNGIAQKYGEDKVNKLTELKSEIEQFSNNYKEKNRYAASNQEYDTEVRNEYLRGDLERELSSTNVPPVVMNELRFRFGLKHNSRTQLTPNQKELVDNAEKSIRKKIGRIYPELKVSQSKEMLSEVKKRKTDGKYIVKLDRGMSKNPLVLMARRALQYNGKWRKASNSIEFDNEADAKAFRENERSLDEGTHFQSLTNIFKPVNEQTFNSLVDRLRQTGLARDVVTDKAAFDAKLDEIVNNNAIAKQTLSEMDTIKQEAIANGTFMLAPNGKSTKLNENQWLLVRTKPFLDWFGDWINNPEAASKVVDENGEPLVVYHGTKESFNKFNKNKTQDSLFWFSSDYEAIKDGVMGAASSNVLMPVFLDIKNLAHWEVYKKLMTQQIIDRGYDGEVLDDVFVAFEPTQIKGAISNNGEFDSSNPDIRLQVLWHGSPHSFKKFSTDYMGSGEGVLAYGWGLYFTDKKGIADSYAKGKDLKVSHSNLYDVKIHGDKNVNDLNLIRWDKEISKSQLDSVNNTMKQDYPDFDWQNTGLDFWDVTEATGQEIYKALSFYMEDYTDSPQDAAKAASLLLLKSGIDGIQYPSDYRKKGSHEESYNYVIFDDNIIEISDKIRLMRTNVGDVYGFVTPDGTVYHDSTRMNANTPIHEFGHLWNSFTKKNNADLYNLGVELVKDSEYWQRVNDNPSYRDLSDEAKVDEALAMAIGDKGESIVNRNIKQRFVDWVKDVWNSIREAFGFKTDVAIDVMTLSDFTDLATKQLLGGEKLVDTENYNTFGTNEISRKQQNEISLGSSERELRKVNEGDRLSEIASRLREMSTRNVAELERLHERSDREKRIAFDFAKENNLWVDDLYDLGLPYQGGGNENTLALNTENGKLYKSNNLSNSDFLISNLIEQTQLHNALFPNTKYTLEGFTGFENGNSTPFVEVILSQNFIPNTQQASIGEIEDYMSLLGFKKITDSSFTNGDVTVSDLHPRNVLKSKQGNIYVIDDIIRKNNVPPVRFQSVNDIADATNSTMTEEVRSLLDSKIKNLRFRIREAWEDRHLAVKDFLNTLRNNGVEIAEYNDYYKQVTHTNGKIDAQLEHYNETFQKPLNKAISEFVKAGFDYRDIENYAILKHGLERNEWLKQDAINKYMANNPEATPEQIGRFELNLPNDYSGITAVEDEVDKYAELYINDFEVKAGKDLIDNLWKRVKDATSYSLNKQLEGQLIDKKTLEDLKSRYDYYVPLRGHDAEVAEDRWDYSPDMGIYFVAPLLKAKGRKTRSESPFAYIASMAQSAINSANRNWLNQTLLRLARKDTTGVMGVSKSWFVKDGMNADGVPIYKIESPMFSENPEQYRKNIEVFEERMAKLAEAGLAVQSGKKLDISGMFIKRNQADQHEVHVWQNGTEYVVYINANPAVARAINGSNAKDLHKDLRFFANVSRQMAANFTTRNSLFVASNFSREYIFSSSILPVKENAKYALQFQRNMIPSADALQRYVRGKADLNKQQDRYLNEYILNGAKTGFSHILVLQKVQKQIERDIKKGECKNGFRSFLHFLEGCNEFAENLSRLSVYITSREQGRSITQSISDAKEVTVNFNRNGAGGYGAAWFRSLYLFVNAGIQALSNFAKVAQKNMAKTAMLISSYAMSGFLMPMLNALIGGDDGMDDYLKLSDWERQNNLCFYTGNGFIKIPLPHELRVFHAMGDNIYQAAFGRKDITEAILDVTLGFADLIPANPMGAIQGSRADIMPDAIKPFFQLAANRNFTGSRISNEWADPNKPGYLRVRTNKKSEAYAPVFLVKLGELLDTATGGDGVEKGLISFNPDEVNHILKGYFGGLYTIGTQVVTIGDKVYEFADTGEFKLKVRETPLKTFYTSENDLQTSGSGLNTKYSKVVDDTQKTMHKLKGFKDQVGEGKLSIDGFAKKLENLNIPKANELYGRIKQIKKCESALKELDGQDRKDLEMIISNLKKEVIEVNYKLSE